MIARYIYFSLNQALHDINLTRAFVVFCGEGGFPMCSSVDAISVIGLAG
jgi:hypothetical protein